MNKDLEARKKNAGQLTNGCTFHGRKTICLDLVYYISNEHAVRKPLDTCCLSYLTVH